MGRNLETLEAMIRASIEKRWNNLGAFVTEDVTACSPMYDVTGREAWVATIRERNDPLEDIRVVFDVHLENDAKIIAEWLWSVAHPFESRRVELIGMSLFEFRDGKISNIRHHCDVAALAAALEL